MADISSSDWDVGSPADSSAASQGASKIRLSKQQVALRNDKEHEDFATGGLGGEHVEGSARAWVQATAPTYPAPGRTDTSFSQGRLFVDTDNDDLYYYDSSWKAIKANAYVAGSIPAGAFGTGVIAEADIGNNEVTAAKIADTDAIDTAAKIAAGIIGGTDGTKVHIEAASITTADISATAAILFTQLEAVPTRIKTGTYSGTSADGNAVTGVGFQPKVIILGRVDRGAMYIGFQNGGTTNQNLLSTNSADIDLGVIDFDSDGFTLEDCAGDCRTICNLSGQTHFYIAFS